MSDAQQQESTPTSPTTTTTTTPITTTSSLSSSTFNQYTSTLGSKYQDKIKDAAQRSKYTLELTFEDGHKETQTYTRTKLLQWQYDEIEDLRAEASELVTAANPTKPREAAAKSKELYIKAAQYLLFNIKTEKTMTLDEYNHCYFPDLRPVLDAAIMLALLPDPN